MKLLKKSSAVIAVLFWVSGPMVSLKMGSVERENLHLAVVELNCDVYSAITPTLIISDTYKTRGNDLRLQKSRLKYDMHKFYFTNSVVDQWNSLPNWLVTASNTKIFNKRLDQYWQHQDIVFDFRPQIERTGSRSEVSRVDIV